MILNLANSKDLVNNNNFIKMVMTLKFLSKYYNCSPENYMACQKFLFKLLSLYLIFKLHFMTITSDFTSKSIKVLSS